MSNVVDNRVLEMRFDNAQFERGVATSMSTLDKLKAKLNLTGASKGLDNLGKAAKNVRFDGLNAGIDTVQAKFSAMQVVGVTALANITNSAITAGKRIASALTIEPVKTGFQEYETQMGAIQTILANTQKEGTNVERVNAALDELNYYADKTIYNFTEMTRNIGTFTAAGVKLDTSVNAIKGIANLAAASGSTPQQASTAMYQLSQALAAGTVKLMDWNSVVNAGMGGQLFQDALIRTSELLDTGAQAAIKAEGSFRESLSTGWLTTEVLTETLNQIAGAYSEAELIAQGYTKEQARDIVQLAETAEAAATEVKTLTQLWDTLKEAAQSGWGQTWRLIVGDFDEAKELFTGLSDALGGMISASADSRNQLLEGALTSNWDKLTGKIKDAGIETDVFEDKIKEVARSSNVPIDALVQKYGSLEKAFQSGAISANILREAIKQLSSGVLDLDGVFRFGDGLDEASDDVKKIQQALEDAGFTLTQFGVDGKYGSETEAAVKAFQEAEGLLADGIVGPETIAALNDASEKTNDLYDSVSNLIDGVSELGGRELLIESFKNTWNGLKEVFDVVHDSWQRVFPPASMEERQEKLYGLIDAFHSFTEGLTLSDETASKLSRTFDGLFAALNLFKRGITTLASPIKDFLFTGGLSSVADVVLGITASVGDFFTLLDKSAGTENFFSGLKEGLIAISREISDVINPVCDGVENLGDVLLYFGTIASNILGKIGNTVKNVFTWIADNVSPVDVFAGLAGGGIFVLAKRLAKVVKTIQGALGNLFKKGNDKKITKQFSEILDSVKESISSFTSGIKAASLISIAVAIGILSASLNAISKIDGDKLFESLGAIGAMFVMLSTMLKSVTKTLGSSGSRGLAKAGLSMILVAVAMRIFASALKELSGMSIEDIGKSLAALGGGLLELSGALKLLNKVKIPLKTSVAMIALAKACDMLGDAFKKFSVFSWDEIARGLAAMGGSLGELTVSLAALSKAGGFGSLLGGSGILVAAQALEPIATALSSIGTMSWDAIGKGFSGMGGALAEFTAALGILSKAGGFGATLGSVGILIGSQSLDEIAGTIEVLGKMSWDEIEKGLSGMGGALTEFTAALGILSKVGGFGALLGGGGIVVAAQALGPIAMALADIGSLSWNEIGKGLSGMGGALAEVATVSGLLGKLTGLAGLLGGGAIALGVQGLGELADAFKTFGQMSWDEITQGLAGMGGALTEVGTVTGLLGNLGGFGSIFGGVSIGLVVKGLGELADAFSKFGQMNWDEIKNGLVAMGGALGETALGGIANTFSILGSYSISEMAAPLGDLADSVRRWTGVTVPEGLSNQLKSLASGVKAFNFADWGAEAISTLATPLGALATSIGQWTGVVIPEDLGTGLTNLAEGVKAFNFAGWGADGVAAVATPLGDLAGSIAKWEGVTVPDDIETGLTNLANGVKAFNFADWGSDTIATVASPLGELAASVGKWHDIAVPDDIDIGLANLATGVEKFNFAGWGAEAISTMATSLGDLAGSIAKWDGVIIPEDIGTALTDLATGVIAWNGVDPTILDGLATPITTMAAAVAAWNDVTIPYNIQTSLEGLAKGIGACNDMSTDSLSATCSGIRDIAAAVTDMLNTDFGAASLKLQNFASAINSVTVSTDTFTSLGTSVVDSFANGIQSGATSQLSTVGASLTESIGSGMESSTGGVVSIAAGIATKIRDAISGKTGLFVTAGGKLILSLAEGIEKSAANAIDSAKNVASRAATASATYRDSFVGAGFNAALGFAGGISSGAFAAVIAASAMASAAASAARAALDEHSPSKVFYGIGAFAGEGLVNALADYMGKVYQTGANLAVSAKDGLNSAISQVYDIFSGDLHVEPTIRPVVDLSAVEAGAGAVDRMFSNRVGIRTLENLSFANVAMNRQLQNGSNADVVSAINKLGKKLNGGNTTINNINGVTYDDGSNINEAVASIVRAARVERRR